MKWPRAIPQDWSSNPKFAQLLSSVFDCVGLYGYSRHFGAPVWEDSVSYKHLSWRSWIAASMQNLLPLLHAHQTPSTYSTITSAPSWGQTSDWALVEVVQPLGSQTALWSPLCISLSVANMASSVNALNHITFRFAGLQFIIWNIMFLSDFGDSVRNSTAIRLKISCRHCFHTQLPLLSQSSRALRLFKAIFIALRCVKVYWAVLFCGLLYCVCWTQRF